MLLFTWIPLTQLNLEVVSNRRNTLCGMNNRIRNSFYFCSFFSFYIILHKRCFLFMFKTKFTYLSLSILYLYRMNDTIFICIFISIIWKVLFFVFLLKILLTYFDCLTESKEKSKKNKNFKRKITTFVMFFFVVGFAFSL